MSETETKLNELQQPEAGLEARVRRIRECEGQGVGVAYAYNLTLQD